MIQIPATLRRPKKYILEMLLSSLLVLFLSAIVAFAVNFPRHGVARGAPSMIEEEKVSALSIICGSTGTDKEKPAAYSGPHASSIQDCLAKCRGSNGCQSVAFDRSTSVCLLYKAPVSGNINYDGSQVYQFYDLSCPQGEPSGITSVLTITVTAPPRIATSTVVVIVAPTPTTPSTTSISTSTFVVVVTVTQGVPLSSTSGSVIKTMTIYTTILSTTTSLPNPPASTLKDSSLSTSTTSINPTSSSVVIATPDPGGLLCNVSGWSASTTSFFDDTGNLGNQVACELACRVVSCRSYGFSNTTCLAYPGSVSESVVLNPDSVYRFFDAGCPVTHR
jgi:PAN domain